MEIEIMKLSVKELMEAISALPELSGSERRIEAKLSYFNADGIQDETQHLPIWFSKNQGKTAWQIEWPKVKAEQVFSFQ